MKTVLGKALLPLVVLIVAGFITGYLIASKPKVAPQEPVERVWPVTVTVAEVIDKQPLLELYGEVAAGRQVDLRPLVSGEVVKVHPQFLNGGIVPAGAVLVELEAFDYAAALEERKSQLLEAEARLAELRARKGAEQAALVRDREMLGLGRRDLTRQQRLEKQGTVSAKLLDQAKMELARLRQTVSMRENNLQGEDARIQQQAAIITRMQVGVARAERDLLHTKLTAPFAGILDAVSADIGRQISPNDSVARLLDSNRLEAKFTLTDAQYGRLIKEAGGSAQALQGRPVQLLWRVGGEDLAYAAHVDRIGARIEAASGGVEIYARFEKGALELPIRPGAFVAVKMADRMYRDVISLPATALYDGDTLFVVEDGRTARRKVRLIGRDGDQILLRGEILSGDNVVTTRIAGMGPSLKVTVREP